MRIISLLVTFVLIFQMILLGIPGTGNYVYALGERARAARERAQEVIEETRDRVEEIEDLEEMVYSIIEQILNSLGIEQRRGLFAVSINDSVYQGIRGLITYLQSLTGEDILQGNIRPEFQRRLSNILMALTAKDRTIMINPETGKVDSEDNKVFVVLFDLDRSIDWRNEIDVNVDISKQEGESICHLDSNTPGIEDIGPLVISVTIGRQDRQIVFDKICYGIVNLELIELQESGIFPSPNEKIKGDLGIKWQRGTEGQILQENFPIKLDSAIRVLNDVTSVPQYGYSELDISKKTNRFGLFCSLYNIDHFTNELFPSLSELGFWMVKKPGDNSFELNFYNEIIKDFIGELCILLGLDSDTNLLEIIKKLFETPDPLSLIGRAALNVFDIANGEITEEVIAEIIAKVISMVFNELYQKGFTDIEPIVSIRRDILERIVALTAELSVPNFIAGNIHCESNLKSPAKEGVEERIELIEDIIIGTDEETEPVLAILENLLREKATDIIVSIILRRREKESKLAFIFSKIVLGLVVINGGILSDPFDKIYISANVEEFLSVIVECIREILGPNLDLLIEKVEEFIRDNIGNYKNPDATKIIQDIIYLLVHENPNGYRSGILPAIRDGLNLINPIAKERLGSKVCDGVLEFTGGDNLYGVYISLSEEWRNIVITGLCMALSLKKRQLDSTIIKLIDRVVEQATEKEINLPVWLLNILEEWQEGKNELTEEQINKLREISLLVFIQYACSQFGIEISIVDGVDDDGVAIFKNPKEVLEEILNNPGNIKKIITPPVWRKKTVYLKTSGKRFEDSIQLYKDANMLVPSKSFKVGDMVYIKANCDRGEEVDPKEYYKWCIVHDDLIRNDILDIGEPLILVRLTYGYSNKGKDVYLGQFKLVSNENSDVKEGATQGLFVNPGVNIRAVYLGMFNFDLYNLKEIVHNSADMEDLFKKLWEFIMDFSLQYAVTTAEVLAGRGKSNGKKGMVQRKSNQNKKIK